MAQREWVRVAQASSPAAVVAFLLTCRTYRIRNVGFIPAAGEACATLLPKANNAYAIAFAVLPSCGDVAAITFATFGTFAICSS